MAPMLQSPYAHHIFKSILAVGCTSQEAVHFLNWLITAKSNKKNTKKHKYTIEISNVTMEFTSCKDMIIKIKKKKLHEISGNLLITRLFKYQDCSTANKISLLYYLR